MHNGLDILFDDRLRFQNHSTEITIKTNRVLDKNSLDSRILTKLFTTLVQPILEYSNAIWGPYFVLDQRKVESAAKILQND